MMDDRAMRLATLVIVLAACGGGKGGGLPPLGDGGSGRICSAGEQCLADEFCDFARNGCGLADEVGICIDRPIGCPDVVDPVCGCDNKVHGNSCEAALEGADVNAFGSCPVPSG